MVEGRYKFILFISGMSFRSVNAIENLNRICDEHLQGNFDLQIIDISKDKEKAIEFEIFAVPALIKLEQVPRRMIIGDLSDTEKVLKILDII